MISARMAYTPRRPAVRELGRGECYVLILLASGERYATRIGRHMGVGRVTVTIGGTRVRATKDNQGRWTYTPSREEER